MKATLLFDCPGSDPDNPGKDRIVPGGTILEGPECWMHCLPDMTHVYDEASQTWRWEGVIRAEPADDECREKIAAIKAEAQRQAAQVKHIAEALRNRKKKRAPLGPIPTAKP